jgi:hypothetical protein
MQENLYFSATTNYGQKKDGSNSLFDFTMGSCMTNNIIYKATVTTKNTNDTKHYIGMTATTFKEHYANHTSSFHHKRDSNKTELYTIKL